MRKLTMYSIIGIGGMVGSCLRFLISTLFEHEAFITFPWATLVVNISGAFLLSFILFLPMTKQIISPTILPGITTGIIGSYTTFSTLNVEVIVLFAESALKAILYLLITIIGGLFACFIGFKCARNIKEEVNPS